MSDANRCEKCGGVLPVGALGGRCPRCLLQAGLASDVDAQRTMTVAATAPGGAQPGEHRLPATIARYRIVRLIGEGGMGAVYEAEQDQPRRTVALKIIKPGMASPALLRRFEQEAQALGRLQHPGIAQIYEAGTADTGFGPQPYFAMEFIRGRSLKDYAEEHGLNTRDRLEMMAKVADAVHHAHQRGLIHRDLKPGNILVDETGQPKILDFGVARVTDRDAQATSQTDVGQLIGTLAYMSPEQVLADPLELDTRSDVYALGVILYELLAGKLPYNIGNKLHEALHAIREEDPSRLSSVSHGYKGDVETIVAKALEKDKTRRYSSAADFAADIRRYLTDEPIEARPPSLSYQLRKFARRHTAVVAGVAAVFVVLVGGIVASTREAAMAHRERDRATTAEQKATQARDLAVSAEQTATQARDQAVKSEQQATDERNHAVTAEAQARKDQQRADTEAATAKALNDFLGKDLLQMANPLTQAQLMPQAQSVTQAQPGQPNQPSVAATPNLTVKEALDRAAKRVSGKFEKQPLVEAAIRETIGGTYLGLGRLAEARDQFELAVALRRREQGNTHPDTLKSTVQLAGAYQNSRLYQKAEDLAKQVVQDARRGPGEDNPSTRSAVSLLASVYSDSNNTDRARGFPETERFLKNDVLEYDRRTLGDGNSTTASAVSALVNLYRGQSPPRYAEAEAFLTQIIADQRRKLGEDSPVVANSVSLLLALYQSQMPPKYAAAEAFLKRLVEERRKVGPDKQSTVATMRQLASIFLSEPQKNYAEAEMFLKPLVDDLRRNPGDDHLATLTGIEMLTEVYIGQPQPKFAEAEAFLKPALEEQRRKLGPTNRATLNTTTQLAKLYLKQTKYREAEALLTPLVTDELVAKLAAGGHKAVEENPYILDSLDILGQVYSKQSNSAKADVVSRNFRKLIEIELKSQLSSTSAGEDLVTPLLTLGSIAVSYIAMDRDKDAEDALNTVLEGYRQVAGKGSSLQINLPASVVTAGPTSVGGVQLILGLVTLAADQYTTKKKEPQAEHLLKTFADINHEALGDGDPNTHRSVTLLASWYLNQHRYPEAEDALIHLIEIQSSSLGPTHPNTRNSLNALSNAYGAEARLLTPQGKPEQVRTIYEKMAEIQARLLTIFRSDVGGEQSSNTRQSMAGLAMTYGNLAKYAQAEEVFTQLLAIQRSAPGVQPAPLLEVVGEIGWAQFHQQKYEQAEMNLREALRGEEQIPLDVWERYNIESMLGSVLVAEKKYAEAEPHLLTGYEKMLQRTPRINNPFVSEAVPGERILQLYQEWGKPDKVAEWKAKLEPAKSAAKQ